VLEKIGVDLDKPSHKLGILAKRMYKFGKLSYTPSDDYMAAAIELLRERHAE
jgi:hypothetical protein